MNKLERLLWISFVSISRKLKRLPKLKYETEEKARKHYFQQYYNSKTINDGFQIVWIYVVCKPMIKLPVTQKFNIFNKKKIISFVTIFDFHFIYKSNFFNR